MPITETVKPSDGARKKTTENSVDGLAHKRSGFIKDSSNENQSRGDDLSPIRVKSSKRPSAKKVPNDNPDKRVKTPVTDRVPKKSIQRAKGSMALNKTIEAEERRKRGYETEGSNYNSVTTIKDNPDGIKLKNVRSKAKQSAKCSRPGSEKRVPSGKKKNWSSVAKKESGPTMTQETAEAVVVPPTPPPPPPPPPPPTTETPKTGEIQTEGIPLASCSFFEKLQQGVRAYFASRNSLTDDKSKKKVTEGGIDSG